MTGHFKKNESKVQLGRASISDLAQNEQSAIATNAEQVREAESTLRNLMRLCKTGVYAPSVKSRSGTTKAGPPKRLDTTLNDKKKAIAQGFSNRQASLSIKKPMQIAEEK